ncbi:hypothetical protein [Luteibacter sp. ME-Dv--P-043b]|uniref:hypothetical protein n=1 Tax=Luteibacter sp. ME-Dv--P-043b TaxID=3040291 RepID=UPI002552B318|nr:hypothetical protein [Luteibacter sp. ME-Dv--P-043b]
MKDRSKLPPPIPLPGTKSIPTVDHALDHAFPGMRRPSAGPGDKELAFTVQSLMPPPTKPRKK